MVAVRLFVRRVRNDIANVGPEALRRDSIQNDLYYARHGDVEAMLRLSEDYENGQGVQRDGIASLTWAIEAVRASHAIRPDAAPFSHSVALRAMHRLASMFVELQLPEAAFFLYAKALERGFQDKEIWKSDTPVRRFFADTAYRLAGLASEKRHKDLFNADVALEYLRVGDQFVGKEAGESLEGSQNRPFLSERDIFKIKGMVGAGSLSEAANTRSGGEKVGAHFVVPDRSFFSERDMRAVVSHISDMVGPGSRLHKAFRRDYAGLRERLRDLPEPSFFSVSSLFRVVEELGRRALGGPGRERIGRVYAPVGDLFPIDHRAVGATHSSANGGGPVPT